MYCKRKKPQAKYLSKAKQFKEDWESKLETFVLENSMAMPNKKDRIKIKDRIVPKYHLLCS